MSAWVTYGVCNGFVGAKERLVCSAWIPRLGTWRKQKHGFYEKVVWPPMALRIGLLRSSALHNDGLDAPVSVQSRTSQETNPKGHWGPNYFLIKSLLLLPPCTQSWYTQFYDL